MRMTYGLGEMTTTIAPDVATTVQAQQSVTDQIIGAIGKIIPLWQQQQVFNAQLKLAKQQAQASGGMINPSQLTVPGIPVNVGMDSQTKTMLMLGIGALAVILLMQKKGR